MKTRSLITCLAMVLITGMARGAPSEDPLDSLLSIWQDGTRPDSTRVMAFSRYIMFGYMYSRPDTVPELTRELHDYGRVHDYGIAIAQAHNLDGIANDVQGNYEEALTHYQKALLAYEEAGKIKGAANCLANIAAVYASQGNYAQALEFDQKALARRKEMGDKQGMAGSYNNIGLIQREMGNYPAALRSFMSSSAIFEELGDDRHLSKALGNLGIVYKDQGDLERAKEYYEKALRLKEKVGEQDGESQVLNNLGEIYLRQDNYAKALEYFERSGAIAADVGDKGVHAVSLGNIGATYAEMDRYAEAVAAYEKSLLIKEGIGDKRGVAHAIINIGSIHVESGSTATGLAKCLDGLEQSEELGSIPDMEQACECLYTGYKAIGNAGKALQYFQRFVAYRDSMYNEDNTKEFTRIEMQYDFDKKEAATQAEQEKKDAIAAEELRRQKVVRNGFMGGFVLVALFAGVFFTQRNRIGKEKARSEGLLLNILPEEVAEELKEKGEADAKLIDQVTVLFTDFKGFTAMSEKLSPKELVKDLHECFSAFDKICEEHGLEKIKTIGDAYMAAGGLPTPNTTHATDVIMAALAMRDFIAAGKEEKMAAGLPYFEIRIGVHTGPVVAGIVGVKKFQYDIWGDTVNTAARMESSGEVGQVNISEATYRMVAEMSVVGSSVTQVGAQGSRDSSTNSQRPTTQGAPRFTFTPRGKVQAKGKGELEMYFVEERTT